MFRNNRIYLWKILETMDILDFFLSIRLNIKIIRRVYIYRIIERTEENRNSRGGGNLLDCPGRKKLLDSGISVDYSPFHYSEPLGGILSCSLLPLLSKRFFFFCWLMFLRKFNNRRKKLVYFFICLVEEKFYFYFFLLFLFHSIIALPVLSTVNQVKHRGGTRDVDVSKAVVALHL